MANHNKCFLWAVLIAGLVAVAPLAEAAMSCGTVAQSLGPCVNYLRTGGSGVLPAGCCTGIKSLYNAAQSTPDRQAVCGCLKQAASAFPSVSIGVAASIPPKCGVNLPYKIDPSTDCSKVR